MVGRRRGKKGLGGGGERDWTEERDRGERRG